MAPSGKTVRASSSLGYREELVGLVLVRVDAATHRDAAVLDVDARVVPRGDASATELVRQLDEPAHLQVAIAHRTGIGRATARVLGDEVADDRAELLGEIDRLERNPESGCNHARTTGVGDRAARFPCRFRLGHLDPVAHEQTDERVPALREQERSDGAVDAAAHGDEESIRRSEAAVRGLAHESDAVGGGSDSQEEPSGRSRSAGILIACPPLPEERGF
jgi:hypothetical protein